MKMSPYLSFDGECEAAFNFYGQYLSGKIGSLVRYEGSPMADAVPTEWESKVMHGEFKLGEEVLMGSDCMPGKYEPAKGTYMMVSINNSDQAEKALNALANGGTVTRPITKTFWAAKFGMASKIVAVRLGG